VHICDSVALTKCRWQIKQCTKSYWWAIVLLLLTVSHFLDVMFVWLIFLALCLDCPSHAFAWQKPVLVSWPVPVEPDCRTCFWVRATEDPFGTGPSSGGHVHGSVHRGETPLFCAFCHSAVTHLAFKLEPYSLNSEEEEWFHCCVCALSLQFYSCKEIRYRVYFW